MSVTQNFTLTIDKADTTTQLFTSLASATYGQNYKLTAVVTPAGQGAPTGMVDFFDTTTNTDLGSFALTLSLGFYQAVLTNPHLHVGTHSIKATYSGDANFDTSFGTKDQVVTKATTSYTIGNDTHVYGSIANLAADLPPTFDTGIYGENLSIAYDSVGNTVLAHVNTYDITGAVSDGTGLASDYTVDLTNGVLTVTKARISHTIGNDSHSYGSIADLATDLGPTFNTGINGQNLSLAYSSAGNSTTAHRGTYAITAVASDGTGLLSDYDVTLAPGLLTVNPALITHIVGNASHAYGTTTDLQADLGSTFMTGINGETLAITYSSAGNTPTAFAGTYPIDGVVSNGTGFASDYSAEVIPGTLTVTGTPPTVTNPTVTLVSSLTATLGGTVTAAGSGPLIRRGVLYSVTATNSHPTIGAPGVFEVDDLAATTGTFTEALNGLTPGTPYSFVAFAVSAGGTTYTSPVSTFTTTTSAASGISGPTGTLPGQAQSYKLLATDPAPGMQGYLFLFKIKWGDGTLTNVSGHVGDSFIHTWTNTGVYTVQISATDGRGNVLLSGSLVVTVANAVMEGSTLYVLGKTSNDTISLVSPNQGTVTVLFNGVSQGTFAPTTGINIAGNGGTDTLVGPDLVSDSQWVLQGAKSGVLTNPGLPAHVTFSGITNLTGGSGADLFIVEPASSLGALNGAGGQNTLSYQFFTTPVTVNLNTHAATSLTSVTNFSIVFGGHADDTLIADNSPFVLLSGGNGNNLLIGGSGADVLLGGSGNDTLQGGSGPSLLIGGFGADSLIAGSGDTILIGGRSRYYLAFLAEPPQVEPFMAIMAEWARTDEDFETRINHLFSGGGVNGSAVLNGTTISNNDASIDSLFGGAGDDWFLVFANDQIHNGTGNSHVTNLP